MSVITLVSNGVARVCQSLSDTDERNQPMVVGTPFARHGFQLCHRTTLLEWVSCVCFNYNLSQRTFFLSVELIEHYLLRVGTLPAGRLQAVAAAAMFVASKLEDRHHPTGYDFVVVTDEFVTLFELFSMERELLNAINWTFPRETRWDTFFRWARNVSRVDFLALSNRLATEVIADDGYPTVDALRVRMQQWGGSNVPFQWNPPVPVSGLGWTEGNLHLCHNHKCACQPSK